MLRRMSRGADDVQGATREVDVLTELLRARVGQYFPDLPESAMGVRLRGVRQRPSSTLYAFEVGGSGSGRAHGLLVKQARMATGHPAPRSPGVADRPRLAPFIDPATRRGLEYRALAAVQRQFDPADARYRALRVYDFIPERQAIVMELSDGPALRDRVVAARLPWVHRSLDRAFENAGAWLHAFHGLREPVGEPRHTTPLEFVAVVRDLAGYLGETLGEAAFFDRVATRLSQQAKVLLPQLLPSGLAHGDYAARNVLVGEEDRVTVIDIAGSWQVPIYEDIAYFIVSLETAWAQLVSQGRMMGRDDLQRYRTSFLAGYFSAGAPPRDELRLYEALLLLDRWVARLWAASGSQGRSSFALRLANRSLRRMLEDLVADPAGAH